MKISSLVWNFVFQISAIATLFGLYIDVIPLSQPRPAWHWALLSVAAIIFIVLMWKEFRNIQVHAPITCKTKKSIEKYMNNWICSGGRTVIFSRDMSWAAESMVRGVLVDKAKHGELTICIALPTPLTDDLKDAGATVITYSAGDYVPRSRFTIVDFEREGARVAIAGNENGRHVIYEFQSGKDQLFSVADDLVRFLMAVRKNNDKIPPC